MWETSQVEMSFNKVGRKNNGEGSYFLQWNSQNYSDGKRVILALDGVRRLLGKQNT